MHDFMQQDSEIEHRESREKGERQPQIPAIEMDNRESRPDDCRDIQNCDQRVKPRLLLMQPAQVLSRQLGGQVALHLLRMICIIRGHNRYSDNLTTLSFYSAFSLRTLCLW